MTNDEIVTYCPECGSEVEVLTQPELVKVEIQTTCDNCGERLPMGELRVDLADVLPSAREKPCAAA